MKFLKKVSNENGSDGDSAIEAAKIGEKRRELLRVSLMTILGIITKVGIVVIGVLAMTGTVYAFTYVATLVAK
ncbi:MAG: hypothetical protein M1483_06295 [Actinobacteria bacterium]|nr:hypothetical protein [Actinomycetota bacterium]MCL6105215.1 hypothetical protein [Actinomycetota bacterium]